jgi:enterochelin esterase family protein
VILDNLIAEKTVPPMVVVMPNGYAYGWDAGVSSEKQQADFQRDLIDDLIPFVQANYRVSSDRKHRALAGLSMGGAQTLNIAVENLDKFGYLGVYSSGVFSLGRRGTNAPAGPSWEEKNQAALDDPKLKKGLKLFWVATGKEDFLLKTSQSTVELLRKHQFDVVYKETDGAHTWIVWREYLKEFASQLFQ